ncbi:hypothetical protein F0562_025831 [Nyssa sinensis]|uniref:Uncharacterized protein n=1 Tax=Nyssa sinensis TaxID=561372 RepID=A0A5J5B8W8_9ASTE|nr:hypothetical protein F0562_025831 [Nyssa sinensis]
MVKKFDYLQICLVAAGSPPMPQALQNRRDGIVHVVNSSDQQLMEQDVAIDNGSNIGSAKQSNAAGTDSGKKNTIQTSKRKSEITLQDLENNFGKLLIDVAKSFGDREAPPADSKATLADREALLPIVKLHRRSRNSTADREAPSQIGS